MQGIVSDYGYGSKEELFEQSGEDYVKNVYINNKALELVTESAKITYEEESGEDAE